MIKTILDFMYIASGLVAIVTGLYAFLDKQHPKRWGTGLFWTIFGLIFIFGPSIKPVIVGSLLLFMGLLTVTKNVAFGSQVNSDEKYREIQSEKIGNRIFIPAVSIGVVAFSVAQFTPLGGLAGLGLGALAALILTMIYTKEKMIYIPYDSSRLLQQMGAAVILPQLLGSLGALFTKAGVGTVIATMMSGFIPEGNKILGVVVYCLAMAIFTMIMGNAFAAITVMTVGIGGPFVLSYGADPVTIGMLALTCGYCGTLCTPMAANFNIVPVAILNMKDRWGVIKNQVLVAVIMLTVQICYMIVFK